MRAGLVSVSFRALAWREVLDLAACCGLAGIEWGGDVHVPCGDVALAQTVGEATRERGLSVVCYGSYCRLTDEECTPETLGSLVATAKALGAPLIRVWAGVRGSAEAGEAQREEICRNAKRLAELAARERMDVAFEFHGGTLTDDADSARRLLEAVACPNVGCLWQPPVGMGASDCCAGIRRVAEYVRNVHVFSWRADGIGVERLALSDGREKWRACLRELGGLPGDRWLLLEFVRGDDPGQLARDAETLRCWMEEGV